MNLKAVDVSEWWVSIEFHGSQWQRMSCLHVRIYPIISRPYSINDPYDTCLHISRAALSRMGEEMRRLL